MPMLWENKTGDSRLLHLLGLWNRVYCTAIELEKCPGRFFDTDKGYGYQGFMVMAPVGTHMKGDIVDTTLGAAAIGFGTIIIGASQPVMSSVLVLAGTFLVFMGTRDL